MKDKIDFKSVFRPRGIAGIEVMVIVLLLLAAATVVVPLFLNRSSVNRENITYQKILTIKKAILGDPQLAEKGSRSSFGFVGDLGVLPVNLTELLEQGPGRPSYSMSNNVWFGWRGPYLDNTRDSSGNYVALSDAWGQSLRYTYTGGASLSWSAEIRSFGPDFIAGNGDDIFITITDEELRTYVGGTFKDRSGNPVEESMVTFFFPNGTTSLDSVQISTDSLDKSLYNSQFCVVSNEYKRKIPIGVRYVESQDLQLRKLASLNGGSLTQIDFVSNDIVELPAELFERTFRPTDNIPDNQFNDIYTAGGNREIINTAQSSGGGYLTISGAAMSWPDDTTVIGFGTSQWEDYRIEANILHGNGHKYQIFYRMSGLSYNAAEIDDDLKVGGTGYGFEFDPQSAFDADYADSSSFNKVVLRIWKYQNGLPRALLIEKEYSASAFQSRFMYPALWRAHQISITIQNQDTNILHHILINGVAAFDSVITDTGSPSTGPAGILVYRHTNFHLYHLLVHKVPPQPGFPFVWWSFEEGFINGNQHVYGFGYLNDSSVLTGVLKSTDNIYRLWQEDNKHGQSIYATGLDDGYIDFGNIFNFYPTDVFSISLWLKVPPYDPEKQYVIFSKRRTSGNDRGWVLLLTKESGHQLGVEFVLVQRESGGGPGGGNQRELVVLNDLNNNGLLPDQWYHIVVTYDGSPFSGGQTIDDSAVTIYVTPDSSNQVTTPFIPAVIGESLRANSQTTHNESLTLGVGRNHTNPFVGYIDEVKIFYKVLTLDEVDELFQEDK